jgi:hypothetical protein
MQISSPTPHCHLLDRHTTPDTPSESSTTVPHDLPHMSSQCLAMWQDALSSKAPLALLHCLQLQVAFNRRQMSGPILHTAYAYNRTAHSHYTSAEVPNIEFVAIM